MIKLSKEVAERINEDPKKVLAVLRFFWKSIKERVERLDLKGEIKEKDEFMKQYTSFVIPKIGTLYCDYESYLKRKKSYNERDKSNKEDKTNV